MFLIFSGMYKQYEDYKDCRMQEWNKLGNSLMFEDYNFPIVALVNYTEVQFLKHDVSEINIILSKYSTQHKHFEIIIEH